MILDIAFWNVRWNFKLFTEIARGNDVCPMMRPPSPKKRQEKEEDGDDDYEEEDQEVEY